MSTSSKNSPPDASSKDRNNYSSSNRHDDDDNNNRIDDGRQADAFRKNEFDGYLTFDSDRAKEHDTLLSNRYHHRGGHHHHYHTSDAASDNMGYINLSTKNIEQKTSTVDDNASSSLGNKRYMFRKQPSVLLSSSTVRESLITVIEIYEEAVSEKDNTKDEVSNQKQRKKIMQDEKRMNRDQLLQEARQDVIFDPKYDTDQDAKSSSPNIKGTSSHSSESSSSSRSKSEKMKSTADPAYKSRHYFKKQAETKNVLQGVILARLVYSQFYLHCFALSCFTYSHHQYYCMNNYRDLHMLDPKINLHGPSIAIRRNAILFNMEPINAIILYNKLFLLIADQPSESELPQSLSHLETTMLPLPNNPIVASSIVALDQFNTDFDEHMVHIEPSETLPLLNQNTLLKSQIVSQKQTQKTHRVMCDIIKERLTGITTLYEDSPFEMRVLEVLLTVLCDEVNDLVGDLIPIVNQVTSSIKGGPTSMELLRQVKNEIEKLHVRVKSLISAIEEVEEQPDELLLMHLTMLHHNPLRYHTLKSKEQAESYREYEDVEVLLDSYLQALETSLTKVQVLMKDIEAVESITLIRLDEARNQLLRIELIFTCFSAVCAFGSMVAGVFGMNLNSFVQEDDDWFWSIASVLIIGSIVISAALFKWMSSRGILYV